MERMRSLQRHGPWSRRTSTFATRQSTITAMSTTPVASTWFPRSGSASSPWCSTRTGSTPPTLWFRRSSFTPHLSCTRPHPPRRRRLHRRLPRRRAPGALFQGSMRAQRRILPTNWVGGAGICFSRPLHMCSPRRLSLASARSCQLISSHMLSPSLPTIQYCPMLAARATRCLATCRSMVPPGRQGRTSTVQETT